MMLLLTWARVWRIRLAGLRRSKYVCHHRVWGYNDVGSGLSGTMECMECGAKSEVAWTRALP
jgi:hypothetical protein